MPIAFDRFVALTAALAGTGAAVTACGSDPVTHPVGSGGSASDAGSGGSKNSAGRSGKGGTTGGAAGRSTGGTGGGRAGGGGNAGRSSGGSAGAPTGGSGSGAPGTGGSTAGTGNAGGSAGSSGTVGQGGEAGEGVAGEAGAFSEGGAGGAPDEVCLGDVGISDCSSLGLPTDECDDGRNMIWRSCRNGALVLRPGVLEGLGACLMSIVDDSCSVEADEATHACETNAAAAACPKAEAAEACANGVPLESGGTITSPLAVCTDGTLTQDGCAELLNAVTSTALPEVVRCADPAGEYGFVSTGTCAERLHACTFPRSGFYPWW